MDRLPLYRLCIALGVVFAAVTGQTLHGQEPPVAKDFGPVRTIVTAAPSSDRNHLSCRVEWVDGRVVPFSCPRAEAPDSLSVYLFETSRLIVRSSSRVLVVDPSSGNEIDTLMSYRVAVSTDARYIAFAKLFGNGSDPDDVYLLYDVTQPPAANRTPSASPLLDVGIPLYPSSTRLLGQYSNNDREAHHAQSALVWVSERLLAFVDRAGDAVSLVLADLSYGAPGASIRQTAVDVSRVIEPVKLPSWFDPSRALEPDSIELLSQDETSATIRLHFATKRWIKSEFLDVIVR